MNSSKDELVMRVLFMYSYSKCRHYVCFDFLIRNYIYMNILTRVCIHIRIVARFVFVLETKELLIYSTIFIYRNVIFINLKISLDRWIKEIYIRFFVRYIFFLSDCFLKENFLKEGISNKIYLETEGSDNNCIYLQHLKHRKVSRNPFSDRFVEIA